MNSAEFAATIDFLMKYSGSVCPICGREIVTLKDLKRARWGLPGDVVHPKCWPSYCEQVGKKAQALAERLWSKIEQSKSGCYIPLTRADLKALRKFVRPVENIDIPSVLEVEGE